MSWFKFDAHFFSNRKIIRAGRDGRDVFVFVLCQNSNRGGEGWIPASDLEPWYLAHQLRVSEQEAESGVTSAVTAGLIAFADDRVEIVGWDEDWKVRGKSRAEIQKDYRQRKKLRDGGGDERYQRYGNALPESYALPDREIDRERERGNATAASQPGSLSGRGSEQEPDTAAGSGSGKSGQRAAKATSAARGAAQRSGQRALADWQPTSAAAAIAHELGLDHAHELAQFRLDAAAHGKTFANADAAFEKWLRGSRDKGKHVKSQRKQGAYTTAPKPLRVRTELGTWLEEGPDGELRPVADPSAHDGA